MRLIDADALIEKCGEWYTEEGPEEGYIGPLKHLLNKQPTIEPKQGEWIKHDIASYRCSECGKIQIADDINELNYCCFCGSRNKIKRIKGADDEQDK